MIQLCTVLNINDNTGAQKGVCLKILNKSKKQIGFVSDLVLLAVTKVKNKNKSKKIYKKELHKGLIIRTKKKLSRYDGSSIKFNENCVVLLKKEMQKNMYSPIGTRILGPVTNELRIYKDRYFRIMSIAAKSL